MMLLLYHVYHHFCIHQDLITFTRTMAIGIGIIGLSASPTAWVSRGHMGALRHPRLSSKYTLKALATSSPSSAAAAAETWGLPRGAAYHTPDQIAADKNVDLVVIGVKLPLHRDLALPSLRAGKDVLIEWPLATNMEEIDELRQAARDGGGKVWVGLQARCSPVILKVRCFKLAPASPRLTS
jgi:predicted dehydrogenase